MRPNGVCGADTSGDTAQNVDQGIRRVATGTAAGRRFGPGHQRMKGRPAADMAAVRAALLAAIACAPPRVGIAAPPCAIADLFSLAAVEPVGVHVAVFQQVDLRAAGSDAIAIGFGEKRQFHRIFVEAFDVEHERRALPFTLGRDALAFLTLSALSCEPLGFRVGS